MGCHLTISLKTFISSDRNPWNPILAASFIISLSLSRSRPRPEKYCSAERIYDKEEAFLCLHCTAHTLECKRLETAHTEECNTLHCTHERETHWRVQHIWLYQFEWVVVHLVEAQFYATQRQQGGVELIGDVYCSVCMTISLITYRRDSY